MSSSPSIKLREEAGYPIRQTFALISKLMAIPELPEALFLSAAFLDLKNFEKIFHLTFSLE